ncbi:MAG: RnfABCDGE type electron transport complex subunit D [Calditrichaeota bacterium]|nr:MAG: RnfABCDGE type electron transport complex subunit D [Calditrichota bacterium]MBL1207225.1 RnfABCDGE type electron transport complex subunit D [Calditrichota bacterium]NOG47058.1 RnfABCDGE type electron transport complex subunit D [Calditrichota bacterium]
MKSKVLLISTSPHLHKGQDVQQIMFNVVWALIPVVLSAIYFFGLRAFLLIAVCSVVSLITEHICQKLRKRETTIQDGSALITGILLGLILPPSLPLWTAALGAVVSITIGKMVFGGLGYNRFNPALVGRAFLQASFPVLMTSWSNPTKEIFGFKLDALTGATPLAAMKFQHQFTEFKSLFIGNISGSLGESSAFIITLSGLYLIIRKIADFRIVAGVFLGTILLGGILWQVDPSQYADPLSHILSGGFLLGTFFMATDMVASPATSKGRWIYGLGIGLLIILIRNFSGLPEGVMYSILLMNALSPLIERYSQPRVFGQLKNQRS